MGNARTISSIVSRTAQTFGYGPKYLAPRIRSLRVTITRGASSASVIAISG